ncbi:MAG: hypothetical protein U1D00_28340 [Mycobacterium sp.]|nr:hypothetical protein [Mycobacterium sp.]
MGRVAQATLIAAAATWAVGAFGEPADALAEPREWDVVNYDDCMAYILADYQTGKRTFQEYNGDAISCCRTSGGVYSETQGCVAPPAEQAQEAERAPAEIPVIGPDATLWMPPPDGPMILYPEATTPGPAIRN